MARSRVKFVNVVGRIAIVVEKELTRKSVTVECPDTRTAYTIEIPAAMDIRIGDCVRAWGEVTRREPQQYYHAPADGSPQEEWTFFPVSGGVVLTWPADVADLLARMQDDSATGGDPLSLLAIPDRAGIIEWMERTGRLLDMMRREPWLRDDHPVISVPDLSDL